MNRDDRNFCSTGFAVERINGRNDPGPDGVDSDQPVPDRARMLTARHCNKGPGEPFGWYDGSYGSDPYPWDVFAHEVQDEAGDENAMEISNYDSALLNPEGNTHPYVYFGPSNATADKSVPIVNVEANAFGQTVTTSGANSGEHSVKIIDATGVYWPCWGQQCENGVIVEAISPDPIAGAGGDSGGPVFQWKVNSNGWYAYGRGVIAAPVSGIENEVPCPAGVVRYTHLKCYKQIIYASLWRVLLQYDAQLGKPIHMKFAPVP